MQKRVAIILLLAGVMIFGSCGYKFTGGGELPKGIQTVFVDLFENKSREVDFETQLTNDLTNEFILKRKEALESENTAEAILTGTIVSVNSSTISQTKQGSSVEQTVRMVLNVELLNRQGETIWRRKAISDHEEYLVGGNSSETDANLQEALIVLSERMAEQIYNMLTEDF